jgi:glutaminyl-tRNA synthetase
VQVITRFPPEPNGYLHIGHAKAMFIDFGLAAKRGGKCLLRFDDTNPEAESQEYIDHIKEIVSWMGWSYSAVTHSSDYFDQLHAFALLLIKADKAYVCHQSGEQIKESRAAHMLSPWRERPIEDSLRLFEDMRRCATACCTLRESAPTITDVLALSAGHGSRQISPRNRYIYRDCT